MSPKTLRWFWRTYIPIAVLMLLGYPLLAAGPQLEARFAPVRTEQSIENVVRSADRLCWEWVSYKARSLVSDDMDVFLDTATDHMVVAVFERDTLMPWGRSRAVGAGQHHRQPYCVLLPPSVGRTDRVVVRQTAWYPGFLGLWRLPVRFPDVVDPPDPPP